MADQAPGHPARDAAAVKVVELAAACCMVVLGVVMQVAQRQASDPDFLPLTGALLDRGRGRWAHAAEAGWAGLAGWCWRRAERFRLEREQVTGGRY